MAIITKELLETLKTLNPVEEVKINPNIVEFEQQIEQASSQLKFLLHNIKIKQCLSKLGQRDSDIYIQCLAKSGTTLTQMILYQMTTDGNMDFEHIYDVSPWIGHLSKMNDAALDEFIQNYPERSTRRLIKSHSTYSFFKDVKKGKFVYLVRNPFDQLVSFFHHNKNYRRPDLTFEDFSSEDIIRGWFRNNTEWIKNENGLDIIYVNYEDIVENKPEVVERLADFLGIEINDDIMKRVLERSSFSFMKAHEEKFGEQPKSNDSKVYNQFIRKGKVGEGKPQFTDEQIKKCYEFSKEYLGNHEVTKRYFTDESI